MGLRLSCLLVASLLASGPAQAAQQEEKVQGYLEWRQGDLLVVDGQWLATGPSTRFEGKDAATSPATIPLGFEVQARGVRDPHGVIHASRLEAKPNGDAMFEGLVRSATDEAEARYRKAGRFYEESDGGEVENIGRLSDSGPRVARARRIVRALVPPYVDPDQVRVYVIDNEEWNAFAMGNYSIYVFSGLLDDMDDDEVALVLGHELAHATHEHTRRQIKKQMWIQLAALGVSAAAETIDDDKARIVTQLVAQAGAVAWNSGYGRDLEDQADRVGLRYAYQAGFDISKAPRLWERFADKYGEEGKVANFFFSDHSLASARARNLDRQIALNYSDGPLTGNTAATRASRDAPPRPGAGTRPETAPGPAWGGQQAPAPVGGRDGGTTRIELGMTPEQVRRRLGEPDRELVYGRKSKWMYPDLSVVFDNGRVIEVRF